MTATAPEKTPVAPVLRAAMWMVVTLLSFTLMAIAVRELSGEIHSFQIMLFRTLGSLVILLPFVVMAETGHMAHRPAGHPVLAQHRPFRCPARLDHRYRAAAAR